MQRKLSQFAAAILIAACGLLIVYPLSVGPAYAFCETDESFAIFDTIYGPLWHLPDPIYDALNDYALYCDRVRERLR